MGFTSDKKMLELANILKSEKRMPYKEFCRLIDIDPGNFAKIKNNENYPYQNHHFSPQHIENACKKLDVDAGWIFGQTERIFMVESVNKIVNIKTVG